MKWVEYWVPEDHLFKTDGDCLDKFPDAGPACGVVSEATYRSVCYELEQLLEASASYLVEAKRKIMELMAENAEDSNGGRVLEMTVIERSTYESLQAEVEQLKAYASQLESTTLETVRVRDQWRTLAQRMAETLAFVEPYHQGQDTNNKAGKRIDEVLTEIEHMSRGK